MKNGDNTQIQVIIFLAFAILVAIMADATYCILTNGDIRWHLALIYNSFVLSIPILFVAGVIIKLIRPHLSFKDILITLYVPVLFWGFMIMSPI